MLLSISPPSSSSSVVPMPSASESHSGSGTSTAEETHKTHTQSMNIQGGPTAASPNTERPSPVQRKVSPHTDQTERVNPPHTQTSPSSGHGLNPLAHHRHHHQRHLSQPYLHSPVANLPFSSVSPELPHRMLRSSIGTHAAPLQPIGPRKSVSLGSITTKSPLSAGLPNLVIPTNLNSHRSPPLSAPSVSPPSFLLLSSPPLSATSATSTASLHTSTSMSSLAYSPTITSVTPNTATSTTANASLSSMMKCVSIRPRSQSFILPPIKSSAPSTTTTTTTKTPTMTTAAACTNTLTRTPTPTRDLQPPPVFELDAEPTSPPAHALASATSTPPHLFSHSHSSMMSQFHSPLSPSCSPMMEEIKFGFGGGIITSSSSSSSANSSDRDRVGSPLSPSGASFSPLSSGPLTSFVQQHQHATSSQTSFNDVANPRDPCANQRAAQRYLESSPCTQSQTQAQAQADPDVDSDDESASPDLRSPRPMMMLHLPLPLPLPPPLPIPAPDPTLPDSEPATRRRRDSELTTEMVPMLGPTTLHAELEIPSLSLASARSNPNSIFNADAAHQSSPTNASTSGLHPYTIGAATAHFHPHSSLSSSASRSMLRPTPMTSPTRAPLDPLPIRKKSTTVQDATFALSSSTHLPNLHLPNGSSAASIAQDRAPIQRPIKLPRSNIILAKPQHHPPTC